MGMDLVGYLCFIPQGADKIIKEHVKNLNSILNETSSVRFIKDIAKKKSVLENPVDALVGLGVDMAHYQDMCGLDPYSPDNRAEVFERIIGDIEELMQDDPLKALGQCRDSNSVQRKINGKYVDVVFAGQATYGDSPDGIGYNILESFNKLGFVDQFEKAINWSKK